MNTVISGAIYPDKNFMSKFIGLVNGDGYIEIGPQKQYNKSNITTAPFGRTKSTVKARLVLRLHTPGGGIHLF